MNPEILDNCHKLLEAYQQGLLGYMKMPEDEHPDFSASEQEEKLCYFTLPMALNYQRNSYKLRESALKSWKDSTTRDIFDVQNIAKMSEEELREKLLKHKVALQPNKHIQKPNKHIQTWKTISHTIAEHWGSLLGLFEATGYDFLKLQEIVQKKYKSGFPYLSGPKIFHYWSYIIQRYGGIVLKNAEYIDIAPDTHVTQCSVRLGVISEEEAKYLSKDQISQRWREVLKGSGIHPIDLHSPLWFWSRNGFRFML